MGLGLYSVKRKMIHIFARDNLHQQTCRRKGAFLQPRRQLGDDRRILWILPRDVFAPYHSAPKGPRRFVIELNR